MTITLTLPPDIEHAVIEEAKARGLSVDALIGGVLSGAFQRSSKENAQDGLAAGGRIAVVPDLFGAAGSGLCASKEHAQDGLAAGGRIAVVPDLFEAAGSGPCASKEHAQDGLAADGSTPFSLEDEGGVPVLRTGRPLRASVVDETLNMVRREREFALLGSA